MTSIVANSKYWLEYNNFSVGSHVSPSCRIGGLGRGSGLGYNSETLLIFDLSSLAGTTVTSATITAVLKGWDGIRAGNCTAMISAQNRKRHDFWVTPPSYDDINAVTVEWDTALQTVAVPATDTGSIVFASNPALVAEVQKLINGVPDFWAEGVPRDWNDGIIARMPTGQAGYYNTFTTWTLDINTTVPATNNDYYYRMQRGQ